LKGDRDGQPQSKTGEVSKLGALAAAAALGPQQQSGA